MKLDGNDSLCADFDTAVTFSFTGVQKLFFWAFMSENDITVNKVNSTIFFIFWKLIRQQIYHIFNNSKLFLKINVIF